MGLEDFLSVGEYDTRLLFFGGDAVDLTTLGAIEQVEDGEGRSEGRLAVLARYQD
jgi:hypothetical protein